MANEPKFPALRYRDYRLLWGALLISSIGSQMQFAAINWHVYVLTGSALSLGLIGLMRFVPIAVFSLVGGTMADHYNRKAIILTTQLSMAACSSLLALLTLSSIVTPMSIYLLTILTSAAFAFDLPAQQAMIPGLVKKKHLGNAMSLNVILHQTSLMLGPAFSGLMIGRFGIGMVYLVNAVSFAAVIWALLALHATGAIEGMRAAVSLSAVREGFTFVRSRTIIWSTMLLDFFSTFFASANALLPLFATDILHVGAAGYGFLYAAESAGAVCAGYIMAHIRAIRHQGKLLLLSVGIYGAATVLFGLSTQFFLSFAALFLVGAGDSVSTIIRNTIRQVSTPDYIRGRMTSINMIFFMGGPQLGEFEAGLLASMVGAPLSVVIGGVATMLVVAGMAFMIPALRMYRGEK